ncbi:MAG: hypothetical protein ACOYNS_00810 [Bacteroidota bacterium]
MINSILVLLFMTLPAMQSPAVNEHVKMELSIQTTVAKKTSVAVAFHLTPNEGIHINTTPAVEFVLAKDSPFELSGKPQYKKTDKDYLETASPVAVTLNAKNNSLSGKAVIKGKLNYFYCSEKDGWCSRFSQPVEITVEIKR